MDCTVFEGVVEIQDLTSTCLTLGFFFQLSFRSYVIPREGKGSHVSQWVDLQLNNQMIKTRLRDINYLPKVTNQ